MNEEEVENEKERKEEEEEEEDESSPSYYGSVLTRNCSYELIIKIYISKSIKKLYYIISYHIICLLHRSTHWSPAKLGFQFYNFLSFTIIFQRFFQISIK